MNKLFYKAIEKWLAKKGMVILVRKDLDVLLAKAVQENPELSYPHWESCITTSMDFDNGYWTVIYNMEQRRSKDGSEFEIARRSFKAIDKNLNGAITTVQKAGNSLINGLSELGKNLFDLEEE